jgi:hypothetical protein
MEIHADGLALPDGVERGFLDGDNPHGMILDNRTGLDDGMIEEAARTYVEEFSAFNLRPDTPIQMYSDHGGSLMNKAEFRTPGSLHDEIRLARWLAERDDDVGAVIGEMVGLAFADGMEVRHPDERTQALFCSISEAMDLDGVFANMYREWLIASQCTTATVFTRENVEYELGKSKAPETVSMAVPRVGVLAAENIRVLGNDTFGTGTLAYLPDDERLRRWLEEYFSKRTSPARKHQMGLEDRFSAAMFVKPIQVDPFAAEDPELYGGGGTLYVLNPKMVSRVTMPKGQWKDPRPMLTRNFPLLEAKRLLNILDFALLQGGSNFIVVAKKGSDQRPAKGQEIANLREVVRRASKVGLIVGDHRLSFEIITPKLDELLNASKRRLVGRKLVMAMMRVAEHSTEDASAEGMAAEMEIFSRVIGWDRGVLARHVKRKVHKETASRNPKYLKGSPSVWFPRIILQGSQYFADFVLKLRDRGDISRKSAVQAAGFDYEAELSERGRELAEGHDEVLIPGSVPHNSPDLPGQQPAGAPGKAPADNGAGRPPGGKKDSGRERKVIGRAGAEEIKAWYEDDPEVEAVVRLGETAAAILEQYPDHTIGRVTEAERAAVSLDRPTQVGTTMFVPVNPGYEVAEVRAVRLTEGFSMLVGSLAGGAIVAKALCFREPHFTAETAENAALTWGYAIEPTLTSPPSDDPAPDPDPEETAAAAPIELHVHTGEGAEPTRVLLRDKDNNIIGSAPAKDPDPAPSGGS